MIPMNPLSLGNEDFFIKEKPNHITEHIRTLIRNSMTNSFFHDKIFEIEIRTIRRFETEPPEG